jgi:hypothetical protein
MNRQLTVYLPSGASIGLRAIEVWVFISAVEVVHGVARIALLEPLIGDFPARQVAVFSGSALIVGTTFLFRGWMGTTSIRDCLFVGGMWVLLTIVSEIVLGKVVFEVSWSRIYEDYDLVHGGLMPFGLIVMFLAPLTAWHFDRTNTTRL